MMSVAKLSIEFDGPKGPHYSGTNVTGRVVLALGNSRKCRGIKVKFIGKARVNWTGWENVEKDDNTSRQEKVNYHSEEEYFSYKYYLAGSSNGKLVISKGNYTYPFTATLPEHLPSSFEGEHGHVRYTAIAILETPGKMDIETKTTFQVVHPEDLNHLPRAKKPVKKEEEQNFCCCWCKSGPLTLVTCLPQTGYVPGQNIPVTIEIDNASNVKVTHIELKIIKNLKWFAKHPESKTKEESKEISKFFIEEKVDCNGSNTVAQIIKVPQMPLINLKACSIINVSFLLKVTACVEGVCSQNLSTEIPLIIGTVPIDNSLKGNSLPFPPEPGMSVISGGDTNILSKQPYSSGYIQPSGDYFQSNVGYVQPVGGMMPSTFPTGLIASGGNPMPFSNQQILQPVMTRAYTDVTNYPGQGYVHPGMAAGLQLPMNTPYPNTVYPNSNAAFNSQYGLRPNEIVCPTAPPSDSDTALLIGPT